MELKEFITTTLLDIKKGINRANVKIAEQEGKKLGVDATCQYWIKGNKCIKFDIAVTASEEKGTEGGGKIKVAIVDIGGAKSSIAKEESISRISFEVDAFSSVN